VKEFLVLLNKEADMSLPHSPINISIQYWAGVGAQIKLAMSKCIIPLISVMSGNNS